MKQHGCFVFKENCDDCAHGKTPKKRKLVATDSCLRSDCWRRYAFAAHVGLSRATRHRKSRFSIGYLRATAGSAPALPTPYEHWIGDLDGMLKRGEVRALVVYSKSAFIYDQGLSEGSVTRTESGRQGDGSG